MLNAVLALANAVLARRERLPGPEPLPEVERACAQSWSEGWWGGLIVGGLSGFCLAVIIGLVRGA